MVLGADVEGDTVLIKQAEGVLDTLQGWVWAEDAGPLENLIRLGENAWIIFGGGVSGLVLMGLEAAGWDLSRLGRALDEKFGLETLSDLSRVSAEELSEAATDILGNADTQTPENLDFQATEQLGAGSGEFSSPLRPSKGSIRLSFVSEGAKPKPIEFSSDEKTEILPSRPPKEQLATEKIKVSPLTQLREEQRRTRMERLYDKMHGQKSTFDPDPTGAGVRLVPEQVRQRQEELYGKMWDKTQPGILPDTGTTRTNITPSSKSVKEIDPVEDADERKFRQDKREHERKKMRADEKYWKQRGRTSWRGYGRGIGGLGGLIGKGALLFGFSKLFTSIFSKLTDPGSIVSKLLRGAGVAGAMTIHKQLEDPRIPRQDRGERLKTVPTAPIKSPTKNTIQTKMEARVEEILGS